MSAIISNSNIIQNVKAQGAGAAHFTNSGHSSKVYEDTSDNWNFTIMNTACSVDIFGRAWFFFKFYVNDILTFNEYTSSGTWQVNEGSSGTRTYSQAMGNGPIVINAKIELYWDDNGVPYLEDTLTFTETIVKLYVNAWSPSALSVEQGKTSSLSISFMNGGNDYMYSTTISVVDAAGLQIAPESQNLEDIVSGGTKSSSFSVTVPSTLDTGNKTVSFRIDYNDFRGVTHSETQTATITVEKPTTILGLSTDYTIYIIAGVITLLAITAIAAYLVFRRRKKVAPSQK